MSKAVSPCRPLKAVLFDGYGALLALDRPFERLQANLRSRGIEVPLEAAEGAFRAELAFCRRHMHLGSSRSGLAQQVDLVLASAAVGVEKPDPGIFQIALARLSVALGQVVHVGDEYESDVLGAQRAGLRAVLLDRSGEAGVCRPTISSLTQLPDTLRGLGA